MDHFPPFTLPTHLEEMQATLIHEKSLLVISPSYLKLTTFFEKSKTQFLKKSLTPSS